MVADGSPHHDGRMTDLTSTDTAPDDAGELGVAFMTHGRRWLAVARALTGDDPSAEDLLQTVLVATLARRGTLRDPEATDAYVRRGLRNQHISAWRQRRRRSEWLVAEVPEPDPVATDTTSLPQRDELWTLVKGLPTAQRTAVALRFYADMTEAQAARLLGCSIGAVKSNTSRGLQRLRDELGLVEVGRGPAGHLTPE